MVPQYLTDIITTVTESSPRPRSADTATYTKPRTRTRLDEHGFILPVRTPEAAYLHNPHSITDNVVFKCKLRTKLLRQAFDH